MRDTSTATATGVDGSLGVWAGLELKQPPPPRAAPDAQPGRDADPANWLERCPAPRRTTVNWMKLLFAIAGRMPRLFRLIERPVIVLSKVAFRQALRPGPAANADWLLGPGVTPARRERFVDDVLRSFYRFIHDVGRAATMTAEQIRGEVEGIDGREHYDAARALKRGVIVATAHLGSFEVGAAALREFEERVHVVFRRDVFAAFEEMRANLHRKLGVIPAEVDQGVDVWMSLRDALRRDEVALMQADRVMPGQRGVPAPFFGGPVEMPVGPVKLAALSGAPIVPVFAIRQPDRRIRLVVEPAIHVAPDEAMVGAAAPSRPMLELAAVIEKHVRAHPEQWLMLHSVWNDAPPNPPEAAP